MKTMSKKKDLRTDLRKVIYKVENVVADHKEETLNTEIELTTGYFHMWMKRNIAYKDGNSNELIDGLIETEDGKMLSVPYENITFITGPYLKEIKLSKDNEVKIEVKNEIIEVDNNENHESKRINLPGSPEDKKGRHDFF